MSFYSIALGAHVGAGTVALVTFWTAVLARKGSRPHVLAGRVYLVVMAAVVLSGAALVTALVDRGQTVAGVFLGYLLVLVATGCWSAWRAIRDRSEPARYASPTMRLLNGLVAVTGAGVMWLGVAGGHVLLVVFGAVGVFGGVGALVRIHRGFDDPRWWIREHYGAMMGNGVATHIAFLSVGLRKLLPSLDGVVLQNVAWFGPLAAALLAIWWLDRRYGARRKISGVGFTDPASRRA